MVNWQKLPTIIEVQSNKTNFNCIYNKKIRYSIKPRCQTYVKNYRFWYFAKNMTKNNDKNISTNLADK